MKNLVLLFLAFIITTVGSTQVISDFEGGDTENWHSEGDGNYLWEPGTGNPGACFRVNDDATGNMNRAYSPVKFHGDWSAATTSDYISADIFLHQINGGYVGTNFVFKISGPGGSAKAIYSPAPTPPFDTWITYSVSIDQANWFVESGTWTEILQQVTTCIVTMEYINGDEFNRMDNITLSFNPIVAPLVPVICSDFESGLFEGWSFLNTGTVSIQSSGGNPGRYVRVLDAAGLSSLAVPSSKYHGSWASLDGYNAEIRVDYKITNISGSLATPVFLVKISGPGGVATFPWDNSIMNAFDQWQTFNIPIQQAGWTIESGNWSSLLNYVTDIQLAAEFIDGNEIVCIDNFCISDLPPATDFTADKTFIFLGESVQFQDMSTSSPNTWAWDFGDTGSSTETNPVHQYNAIGLYDVELTTTNHFGGDIETKASYIEVYPTDQCLKFEDDFDDNAIHPIWSFKNGTWSESSGTFRQTSNHYVTNNFLEGCFATAGSLLWDDYILSCDFQSTDNDYIGFVFNYQDESNMYMFRWGKQTPDRRLSKYVNGVETVLASDAIDYTQSAWYHADIYSISGNLVVSIDGIEIFSVFDNTFTNGKTGLYCWGNQSSYWDNFSVECPGTPLELKVFLEGPFNTTDMKTALLDNNILTLTNPYNASPWNHNQTIGVLNFSYPDAVDWVLVDLRDATSASNALPGTSIAKHAALLLKNGDIVSPYGGLPLYLNIAIANNLYVTIFHRNHLGIMSANAVIENSGMYSYDFTTGAAQAYGTDAQKNLGGGTYGMFAGDADANGVINSNDKTINWLAEVGKNGYIQSDLDLDGQGDNKDKNDSWLPNLGESSQVPE